MRRFGTGMVAGAALARGDRLERHRRLVVGSHRSPARRRTVSGIPMVLPPRSAFAIAPDRAPDLSLRGDYSGSDTAVCFRWAGRSHSTRSRRSATSPATSACGARSRTCQAVVALRHSARGSSPAARRRAKAISCCSALAAICFRHRFARSCCGSANATDLVGVVTGIMMWQLVIFRLPLAGDQNSRASVGAAAVLARPDRPHHQPSARRRIGDRRRAIVCRGKLERSTTLTASTRRMYEPGFFASRLAGVLAASCAR